MTSRATEQKQNAFNPNPNPNPNPKFASVVLVNHIAESIYLSIKGNVFEVTKKSLLEFT